MFLRACSRSSNSFKLLIKDGQELERLKKVVNAESRILSAAFVAQDGIRVAEGCRVDTKFPTAEDAGANGQEEENGQKSAGSTEKEKKEKEASSSSEVKGENSSEDSQKPGIKEKEKKESQNIKTTSSSSSIYPLELTLSTPIGVQTEKLGELKNTVAKKQKDLLYAMAEFQNLQKKQGTEIASKTKQATKRFSLDLLPVIASLNEEATRASELLESEHAFVEGIMLTKETAIKSLNRFDVRQLVPQHGDVFVAAKHEEVGKKAPPSADDEATVSCVKENGWMLREEVLRKASVCVYRSEAPKAAA